MTNDLVELDVFYGDLTPLRGDVYARLPRPEDDAGLTLAGFVRGPRCLYAQTLPANSPLIDLGPGPTLLAKAIVPEPTFWSADLPAIYDVTVSLQRGDEVIATARREIGLRSFGVRGPYFALAGKRWILRGVGTHSTTAKLPRNWHDAAAMYVPNDSDLEPLAEASQWGAMAIVFVAEDRERDTLSRLRALANYPAAAIAVLDGSLPDDFNKFKVAPNLLLAQWIGPERSASPPRWADVLLVSADEPALFASVIQRAELPIIAARFLADRSLDIEAARLACDALQRDLAPMGQFAGYIV